MSEAAQALDAPIGADREQDWMHSAVRAFCEERSHKSVMWILANDGAPQADAERIAAKARLVKRDLFRKAALKTIGVGALWAGGGMAVTIATWMMAEGGGSYIVTWGPVGWGVWTIGKGVLQWSKA